jgi:hypothetical protein
MVLSMTTQTEYLAKWRSARLPPGFLQPVSPTFGEAPLIVT